MGYPNEQIGRDRRWVSMDGKAIKSATNRYIRRKVRQWRRDLEDAPKQGQYRGWVA